MDSILLGVSALKSSRIAYGCWRVAGAWTPAGVTLESKARGRAAIRAAYEQGYTVFDNADIYCRGEAELLLGEVLKATSGMRDKIVLATKGGIRPAGDSDSTAPGRYDFSYKYLIKACEDSLRRLGVETIDLYMLHRPDFLADPEEVARAFSQLKEQGKVRWFGISNFRPTLVTALQAACPMPLVCHQIEISLAHLDPFTDGTLDQCLIEKITPMAWSPLAGGLIGDGTPHLLRFQKGYSVDAIQPVLDEVARECGGTRVTVALAWLLLHPARILPIIGSVRPGRIQEAAKAVDLKLSREQWYRILIAARGEPVP